MSFESIPYINSQNSDDAILQHDIRLPRLPFPPPSSFITVSDFINKRESSSRIFRKSPNAFFIYRKAFTNHLTFLNYKLTMIDVSRLVSSYWKNESKEVKDAYAKIAKEIDVELKEKRKHDKKCPVIWKIDKKSKKQKRTSRRNLKINNDLTNNDPLTKFRNTTEQTFEIQNFPIPINEPNLRSPEEMDSQPSFESSPISTSPVMEFQGIIPGYDIMNYDNSCESQSNESEEENYDIYLNSCNQNLNQIYDSRLSTIDNPPEYNNFINYGLNGLNINDDTLLGYNWNAYINNGNENLPCQQGNGFQ